MDDVAPLYEGRESQDFQRGDSRLARWIKRTAFDRLARHLLRRIGPRPHRVVDFACGNGLITRCMADVLEPGADVVGLDFFDDPPEPMERARYGSFAALPGLAGTADLVLCFHALEHDDDPHRFIGRLTGLLAPGGRLVVEVPNVDCVWTPWFGADCENWYLPFHRVHFSRQSLRELMEAQGLAILAEENVCAATMGHSIANRCGRPYSGFFFLVGVALRPIQWLAEKVTGRPSALRIIAVQPA
ncbi:class I SAM-dependent methyltransferase [Sphingobium sp. WCS2017Hpa-17]|uniref:class I SAM-dependent methyltransferase n=1 Tax=Sphingobium sp. WCS2017Hpa-17 TaxID=3073638 RepID=UPI00288B5D9A|nr:class I SAM-dependent methyltransferase [Sphingobium sp. WCS2017Hpa-17]